MTKAHLISKVEFSRIAGVSPALVTRHIRTTLAPALVGRRIDFNHPASTKFLQKRGVLFNVSLDGRPPPVPPCPPSKKPVTKKKSSVPSFPNKLPALNDDPPKPTPGIQSTKDTKKVWALKNINTKDEHQIPEDLEQFAHMTLHDIIKIYGTDVAFLDWLRATKTIEDIREKRLKNADKEGTLISRELVRSGVIDPINTAHIALLTDGAKTIALRIVTMNKSGRPLSDCEKYVVEQLSSFIRPVKTKMIKALKNA